jgi:hypothetical protein
VDINQGENTTDQPRRSRRRLIVILLVIILLIILLIVVLGGGNSSKKPSALPISYRYPTTTLSWGGFKIHASSCDAVVGTSGLVRATVKGTAFVPKPGPGVEVVGQIETWILNSSGHVIAKGKPWPLPKTGGHYKWTIGGFSKSVKQPASCIVQGINVSDSYDVPQSPSAPSNAAVDRN